LNHDVTDPSSFSSTLSVATFPHALLPYGCKMAAVGPAMASITTAFPTAKTAGEREATPSLLIGLSCYPRSAVIHHLRLDAFLP
jgi:hypothetical protein